MRIFQNIVLVYYKVLEYLKGNTITRLDKQSVLIGHLSAMTEMSYRIDVYCEKTIYERSSLGFIKSKNKHSVFRVYSTTTELAPESLKRACEAVIHFPPLIHEDFDDERHAKILMNAYLDLIEASLLIVN